MFKRRSTASHSSVSHVEDTSVAVRAKLTRLEAAREKTFKASEERQQREFESAESGRVTGATDREDAFRALIDDLRITFDADADDHRRAFENTHERLLQDVRDAAQARQQEFAEQERRHDALFDRQLRAFAHEALWHAETRRKLADEAHAARVEKYRNLKESRLVRSLRPAGVQA